jgi:hypothetical protein
MNLRPVDIEQTIGLLRDAARSMRSVTASPTDEVKAIHAAVNALQARESVLLAQMDESKAHEADGAASIATWAARELLQDPGVTRRMVNAARTMRDLPSFGQAAHSGALSAEHVNAMTYSLKHVGHDETAQLEPDFLDAAFHNPPRELFTLARYAKAVFHPEELDEAWLRGMDKEDISCLKAGDGFHVKGFLPVDVGAKFKVFLNAVSAPRDGDDTRTSAQRRVDGFNELLTEALGAGLPADCGIKPHLSVVVDVETLKHHLAAAGGKNPELDLDLNTRPAILEGFGPIGPALLAYIAFGGELTPILVAGFKENRKVLDVGRTERVATSRQRKAIRYRQKGVCANSGCHHPIAEIHHVVDWAYGGKTNLNNLAGLCRKCHALISTGRLRMTGTFETGYTFATSRAGPLARTG